MLALSLASLPSPPAVHPARQAQLSALQSNSSLLWTPDHHPRFASLPPGASASLCGVKHGWGEAIRAKVERGELREYRGEEREIPESFDSETNWPK